ncbi:MAG: protein kinase [Methanoregula sp.]|nr:protein kinase [Methanoregula sp.]
MSQQADIFHSPGLLVTLGFLILLLAIAPVSAKVIIFNESGTSGAVQDLINSTTSGDSIFLAGGFYPGSLVIDRPISFGALDTSDPPLIIADVSRAGIILDVDGITINGVVISGNNENGLLVRSNNNRISALTVSGFIHGIELQSASNNIFSTNTIVNNSIGVVADRSSRSNIFYLNRFDNTEDISSLAAGNIWFSGSQDYQYGGNDFSGALGNSWKEYSGTDSNGDGIGDTAYTLKVRQSILVSSTAGTEMADRAPLVSSPDSYTLIRSTNTTTVSAPGMREGTVPESSEGGQNQNPNPLASGPYSGQQQSVTGIPQTGPGTPTTPPPGDFTAIILQYWWGIPILIVIAAAGGIWFERSFKRRTLPDTDDPLRTQSPRNATIVSHHGQTLPGGSPGQDNPYFTVHLPPLLEKRYNGAEYMGEGGVGRVFRAWDPEENRAVAIKIPVRFDEVTGAQFTKELHIWQGLHHKNIVEVYAANVFPMPYIEMEFIESSLASYKFPLDYIKAVQIVTGVAKGLQYAHDLGIVHRDIKPENILIAADGTPKITDWGLAKALADTKHTGLISFSLNYAAPEQLAPNIYGDAGKWTDIYQLGVLLYEMVTGLVPFSGTGMGEVTHAILHTTPQPPEISGTNPDLLRGIILKCIQKTPADRYGDVAELLADLKRLDENL